MLPSRLRPQPTWQDRMGAACGGVGRHGTVRVRPGCDASGPLRMAFLLFWSGGISGSRAAMVHRYAELGGDGDPAGHDLFEPGEEDGAGADGEGGEGCAQSVVAALEAGAVGRVGGAEPSAVAEDPVACRAGGAGRSKSRRSCREFGAQSEEDRSTISAQRIHEMPFLKRMALWEAISPWMTSAGKNHQLLKTDLSRPFLRVLE
jgi:hypothetical protein